MSITIPSRRGLVKQRPSRGTNAIEFLQSLRPKGPWVLTAIPAEGGVTATQTFTEPEEARRFIIDNNDDGSNVYYSLARTRRPAIKKAKKEDIGFVEYLHVDADPAKDETPDAFKARMHPHIEALVKNKKVPQPTFVVDTGNGMQFLWELESPVEVTDTHVIEDIEARNYALALALDADPSTRNVDRILRVPGTTNYPNAAKRKLGRVECWAKWLDFQDVVHPISAFPKHVGRTNAEASDRTRDESGSGYGFRFFQDCKRRGLDYEAAREAILADEGKAGEWAQRVDERQLKRAWDRAPGPAGKAVELINLATVEAKKGEWLWRERIPRGQHITMTGLPFVGKSLLLAAFAAQYSHGSPNPDGSPAPRGRVVLLAREDVLASVLKPRLKALGADMERIDVVGLIRTEKGTQRSFLLAEDLQELEQLIRDRPDTLMVGIDPITAYVGGSIDSHKATDVRAVLEPLTTLAERTGVLVFSVTHPAKSSQAAINSFVGSQAFIAVPRIGYLVANELDDDKRETGRVLFSCVGSNIGPRPTTLAYRIEEAWVEPDEDPDWWPRYRQYLAAEPRPVSRGRSRYLRWLAYEEVAGDISVAKIVWDQIEGIDVTADEILSGAQSRGDAMGEAVTFLRIFLKGGPKPSEEVEREATGFGISERTLKRAKKKVCHSYRTGGLGELGSWMSELKREEEE
jgi:hypothetical protein